MLFFVVTITFSLTISFLCSVLEACLLSLSITDIAAMAEKKPVVAEAWKNFRANIQKPIAVILIINTLAHTMGASVSGSQFNDLFGNKWIIVYSILFSLFMIQFTEIVPKTLAVRHNKKIAIMTGLPFKYLVRLFTPVLVLVHYLNKPFEGKKKAATDMDALGDIEVLARFASVNKLITQDEEKIISRGLHFSRRKVEDVMVKRNEAKYLSTSMTLHEALIEAHLHHHTRFLLIEGQDIDRVVGFVNLKDIVSVLQINPEDPSLKGISRPILETTPTEKLSVLLNKLIKGYQHIAVVRDSGGKTAGLVTLEDVIEAIVGKISDEYDILPNYIFQISEKRFLVGGGLSLPSVKEKTGCPFPPLSISLNEWLLQKFSRNPKAEDKVTAEGMTFIVRKVRRSRIYEVILEKCQSAGPG
jgi:putative hemolysin